MGQYIFNQKIRYGFIFKLRKPIFSEKIPIFSIPVHGTGSKVRNSGTHVWRIWVLYIHHVIMNFEKTIGKLKKNKIIKFKKKYEKGKFYSKIFVIHKTLKTLY